MQSEIFLLQEDLTPNINKEKLHTTRISVRKMDQKRIDEVRRIFNVGNKIVVNYINDLDLWIIGGYGPVDIQEEFSKNLLPIPDYAKVSEAFRPYITTGDAVEGFNVYKFKTPFWNGGRDLSEVDIYLIQCTNNGVSYFACANLDVLRSFIGHGAK